MRIRELLFFGCLITAATIANSAPVLTISLSKVVTVATNASGTFVLASTPGVGRKPSSVTAADVNGDGRIDLISANYLDSSLTVLTNISGGVFESNASYILSDQFLTGSPYSVVSADVNGDGKPDLITANVNTNTLSVLTNNGSGGYDLAGTYNVGVNPYSVVATSINGNSNIDLISANYYGNSITVLTNNGAGRFALEGTFAAGTYPAWLVAADVNGDGKPDLITANYESNTVTVLTNDGKGSFLISGAYPVAVKPVYVNAVDVNGDGSIDLITASYPGGITVLTNTGSGSFVSNSTYSVGTNPVCVVAADVNGDGSPDLISVNNGDSSLTVLTNDGRGNFASNSTLNVGLSPYSVVAADVNGDGFPDLISANEIDNTLSVLTNSAVLRTNISNLILSWPTNAPGYSVQEKPALRTANWTTLSNMPVITSGHYQVLLTVGTNTAFFRLFSP